MSASLSLFLKPIPDHFRASAVQISRAGLDFSFLGYAKSVAPSFCLSDFKILFLFSLFLIFVLGGYAFLKIAIPFTVTLMSFQKEQGFMSIFNLPSLPRILFPSFQSHYIFHCLNNPSCLSPCPLSLYLLHSIPHCFLHAFQNLCYITLGISLHILTHYPSVVSALITFNFGLV